MALRPSNGKLVPFVSRACTNDCLVTDAQYGNANGWTSAHQSARLTNPQPPHSAEMLHRRSGPQQQGPSRALGQPGGLVSPQDLRIASEWDEDEFLPLRLRDSPPRQGQTPVASTAAPQRHGQQPPAAPQQHPWIGIGAVHSNWSAGVRASAQVPAETVQVGTEIYSIVSTLHLAKPGDGGMSAGVYVVEDAAKKVWVAKRLSLANKSRRERASAEMQALKQVMEATQKGHENINILCTAFLPGSGPQGTLILEYCNVGSLAAGIDHFKSRGGSLDEDRAFHLMYGIAKGLTMIHHGITDHRDKTSQIEGWKTICHLDLKPANILLTNQQLSGKEHNRLPRVILADFGCSVTCDDITNKRETRIVQEFGTPGWYPPEEPRFVPQDMMGRYGKPTDVWQMGGVIQAVCLLLFQPDMARMERPLGRKYGAELNCLVASCLNADYIRRPTALDLCSEVRKVMVRKGFRP